MSYPFFYHYVDYLALSRKHINGATLDYVCSKKFLPRCKQKLHVRYQCLHVAFRDNNDKDIKLFFKHRQEFFDELKRSNPLRRWYRYLSAYMDSLFLQKMREETHEVYKSMTYKEFDEHYTRLIFIREDVSVLAAKAITEWQFIMTKEVKQ